MKDVTSEIDSYFFFFSSTARLVLLVGLLGQKYQFLGFFVK